MSVVSTFGLVAVDTAAANAQTFGFTINCSPVVVGPVTVLAYSGSGSVTLVAGVPATIAMLPTNNTTQVNNPGAPQGTYTGTLSCTLIFGGVTAPFTRSFSLAVPPAGSPGGLMTTGATSFAVDLGSQGIVNISAPQDTTLGFDHSLVTNGLIIVPVITDTTLLLAAAVPALPPSALILLSLAGSAIGVWRLRAARSAYA